MGKSKYCGRYAHYATHARGTSQLQPRRSGDSKDSKACLVDEKMLSYFDRAIESLDRKLKGRRLKASQLETIRATISPEKGIKTFLIVCGGGERYRQDITPLVTPNEYLRGIRTLRSTIASESRYNGHVEVKDSIVQL
jgi:hypothetical protein